MAAGLPVIVTTGVQIAPDIAAANAGIVIERDIELTNAIIQLLKSPTKRSRLSQNAVKLTKQKYDWRQIASRLIESYKEIVYQSNKKLIAFTNATDS